MPIILNNAQPQTTVKTYTPKFFHDKLTGRGGKSAGLLSSKNNPINIDVNTKTKNTDIYCPKKKLHTGMTTIWQIPINPLTSNAWSFMKNHKRPEISDLILIGHSNSNMPKCGLYMNMEINSIILNETTVKASDNSGAQTIHRDLTQNYQLEFYAITNMTDTMHKLVDTTTSIQPYNTYSISFTSNPLLDLQTNLYHDLTSAGFVIDIQCIIDYIATYEIYDSVVKRSEQWQTNIDVLLDEFFTNICTIPFTSIKPDLTIQIKHLMDYNIPLDLYRNIYKSINTKFTPDITKQICKQNLNLLLSDTMNNLNNNKPLINSFTPPTPTVQIPASVQKLSPEQTKAVQSTEPLILVQAGAGTGKSTLILGRIDYLIACGINPSDITVLSFTNAAAENIKSKNSQVNSMTIASMIHDIYSTNFTGHELSSIDTIINSLDIYYPNVLNAKTNKTPVVSEFQHKLRAMTKNDTNSFTEMNNFIEEHYDEIINILNKIHQTSLELEIIICYQQIANLIEPPSVTSKFLIMDEVQDNSIFEFIYTLKYIDKHKESLFIVGDCSQTLYEFRASNPRALNILESSNTFATFQLNVNYRSNQEILDFANIALQNIEANQYANIQLQANSLATVTEQSFLDKVTFNYHRLDKITHFKDNLPNIFATEIKDYIDKCLAKGEQVAFLMFTRRDVALTQSILEAQYPNQTAVSLVPEKMYNSTIMSTFIMKYWNEIKFAPTTNIIDIIIQEIMNKLTYLVYDAQTAGPKIHGMLLKWKAEQSTQIQIWSNQVNNGQMATDTFLDLVKENMLQYEIRTNAIKQSLLSGRNQQNKQDDVIKNANFLLSTIHSAKGLEFDNVVVFYRNENNLAEDKKRMYYVAFTRAMKSEYILAYDTCTSPQIEADYNTILERLHAKSPAINSPLNIPSKNKTVNCKN